MFTLVINRHSLSPFAVCCDTIKQAASIVSRYARQRGIHWLAVDYTCIPTRKRSVAA